MGDVIIAIAPEVIVALVGLIKLVRQFLRTTTEEQNDIKEDLVALKVDLGIMKDIVKKIEQNNLRNSDGVRGWMEEANRLVNDASTLLQRIEDRNNRPQRRWRKKEQLRCSTNDERQLKELRRRCDDLTKHNETVLNLISHPCGWLLCGR